MWVYVILATDHLILRVNPKSVQAQKGEMYHFFVWRNDECSPKYKHKQPLVVVYMVFSET